MGERRKWSEDEVLLLKALYELYPNYVLAKVLNRSELAILSKANRLGLRKGRRGRLPKWVKPYIDRLALLVAPTTNNAMQ